MAEAATRRNRTSSKMEPQTEPTIRSFLVMHLLSLDTETVTFGVPGDPRWGLVISRADWQVFDKPDSLKVWAETVS